MQPPGTTIEIHTVDITNDSLSSVSSTVPRFVGNLSNAMGDNDPLSKFGQSTVPQHDQSTSVSTLNSFIVMLSNMQSYVSNGAVDN